MAAPTLKTFDLARAQTDPTYEWFGEYNRDPQGFYERYFPGTPHPSSRWGQDYVPRSSISGQENPPSAGPSAGPSEGPSIGLTWPGYWMINPNVEQQYREWKAELRRQFGANTDRHLDMEAFRKHLMGLGAPDPGSPGNTTPSPGPAPTPTPPVVPGVPPIAPVPPRPAPPTVPPGADVPGAPFNPPQRTGTAQEMIRGGLDLGGLSPKDIGQHFPFGEDDDDTASRNLLRALGFNVSVGNPYTSYLQDMVSRLARPTEARALMGGLSPETYRSEMPGRIYGALTSAGPPPGLGLLGEIGQLQNRLGTSEKLPAGQRELAGKYVDPSQAYALYQDVTNLPGALRKAQSRMGRELQERYQNLAPSLGNKTFLQFLYGG